MAEKVRGKFFYEIIIAALVLILVATILYPEKTWKKEEEMRNVCRSRMVALQELEFKYFMKENVYTDSLPKVMSVIQADTLMLTALDSIVNWDQLLPEKELHSIILSKDLPDALKELIFKRFKSYQPIGTMLVWDSLHDKLIEALDAHLQPVEDGEILFDDSFVQWPVLLGEAKFWEVLGNEAISRTIRDRTIAAVRRGAPVNETRDWKSFRPLFVEALKEKISIARSTNLWAKGEMEDWEEVQKTVWSANMDTLSQIEKDSIWQEFKGRFWDKEKELIWKDVRKKIWAEDGESWTKENEHLWKRIALQQWAPNRKKEWEADQLSSLPDSLKAVFPAQKDSLWRTVRDSIQNAEMDDWISDNRKEVDEVIQTIWERETRVGWEEPAYESWAADQEKDEEELWQTIKESLWELKRGDYWINEQQRLTDYNDARKRLDFAIGWLAVLGEEKTLSMVSQLQLPDSKGLWREFKKYKKAHEGIGKIQKSALYKLGVAGLFRDDLFNSISVCPVSATPYLIHYVDTTLTKRIDYTCPIVEERRRAKAMIIDPETADTSYVVLRASFPQKVFGGASIKNHGNINEDGKKSWDKKGR